MLECERISADLDVDPEGVVEAHQCAEGAPEQVAQLILPRQPHRIRERHRVESPLGGPVERQVGAARSLSGLDRHLADGEDLGLCLEFHIVRQVELEPIALRGVSDESAVSQGDGELTCDHVLTLDERTRPGAGEPGDAATGVSAGWGRVGT